MGYVKEYLMEYEDDYYDDSFYFMEEEAIAQDNANEELYAAQLEDEYNLLDLRNALGVIKGAGERFDISYHELAVLLEEFIDNYERKAL